MTNQYHATPYDLSAKGFYFTSFNEYSEKVKSHKNKYGEHVEEYEIQFIDGDKSHLFSALGINQANLQEWFEAYEDLDKENTIKAIYLAEDMGFDTNVIPALLDDVCVFEGSVEEYAEDYIEETGLLSQIPENLQCYFDIQAFARDLLISGEINEISVNGTSYVVWGF
ncbi:antirestriction protein ArdA [Methylophaga thalassica]|uniref:antirestriction protein ArdA n=1 Tax=Methylophaga thalassica TaxID=40223 RepID=UPI002E7AC098|nr:antirestriction protein ArdA [Methylophaga thalassica]WVI84920.1 antirestriction protein ArdA [Methylophaga thalassica]